MPNEQKIAAIAEIKEQIEQSEIAIMMQYVGINVENVTAMRKELREAGVKYKVYKNNLARRALRELEIEEAADVMEGPTGWAFSEDPVLPAKIIKSWAAKSKFVKMRGGVLSGKPLSADQLNALAMLPSREQLLGQVVGTIAAPLRNFVGTLQAVPRNLVGVLDALRKKNAQLERLTQTDPLTNVANRRHFMHSIELEFARLERYKRPMSFFMLDVDHFKKINDEHGHQAGDQVLVNVASILTASVRITDVVSRYGGEEFAILLPETNRSSAFVVAERCRKHIEEMETVFGDKNARVTASFGLVSLPDERISGVRDIISVADKNLYTSKREGRNRITK